MLDYIPNDGYTEDGYIEAEPGMYGELRFSYRPFLVEEQAKLLASNKKLASDEYERYSASEMAKKIVSWTLLDKAKNIVPVSAANILRLKPKLKARLENIVCSFTPSDIDPLLPVENKIDAAETKYESALTGISTATIREEGDEKN